jgi:hypothetical protein
MSESTSLTNRLIVEIPRRWENAIVWRSNTGGAVPYDKAKKAVRLALMGDKKGALDLSQRPIHYGLEGSADISGVLGPFGVRIEIEIKIGRDRQSEQQKNFQSMIEQQGGVYIIARTFEQAMDDLGSIIAR